MNILAIGNSFSQDATRYVHEIARAAGKDLTVVNLYIGGCSLERHFRNMHSGEPAYQLEFNGQLTGFPVSLQEALLNRQWDYITLQQCSRCSTNYETYQPYLEELAAYIKKLSPKAQLVIHQTWAYEAESKRLCELMGYTKPEQMLADLRLAYAKAAESLDAKIIPSGELFAKLLEKGVQKVHRDTFHACKGVTRYALGLLWYRFFTGGSVESDSFADFDEEVTPQEREAAIRSVMEIL